LFITECNTSDPKFVALSINYLLRIPEESRMLVVPNPRYVSIDSRFVLQYSRNLSTPVEIDVMARCSTVNLFLHCVILNGTKGFRALCRLMLFVLEKLLEESGKH